MKSINIGVFIPHSGVLPMGKPFEKGLKEGLKPLDDLDIEVELIKEFAGQTGARGLADIFDRFLNYHEAHIVTGIVSSRIAEDAAERFENRQVPLFACDLGAHIPTVQRLNKYIVANSLYLWRHAWAMGNYGVKHFGPKGMFVSAVYDAGYGFSAMFHKGMMDADPNAQWTFAVAPMPAPGKLSDMSTVIAQIEAVQPDFIFATFCGAETSLFLNEFIRLGLHKKIKVLGLPYLAYPKPDLDDDLEIISSLMYANRPEISPDKVFYELGYHAGATLAKIIPEADSIADLHTKLLETEQFLCVDKEQGIQPGKVDEHISLVKMKLPKGSDGPSVEFLEDFNAIRLESPEMAPSLSEMTFGWMNAYLCV